MTERMTDEDFVRLVDPDKLHGYGLMRDDLEALAAEARRARESEARLLGVMKQAASVFVVETEPPTQGEPVLVGDAYHVTMTWPVKVRSLSIEEAKAEEREACAKVAESFDHTDSRILRAAQIVVLQVKHTIAAAIRGRT